MSPRIDSGDPELLEIVENLLESFRQAIRTTEAAIATTKSRRRRDERQRLARERREAEQRRESERDARVVAEKAEWAARWDAAPAKRRAEIEEALRQPGPMPASGFRMLCIAELRRRTEQGP